MPQDAFHIRRLAQELDSFLVGGKVNRISQVDKDELTFIIYTKKTTVKLILSTNASNARVCLSAVEKEPAPQAPNFCMLLRKHLQGAEILSVRQHEFERIVEIEFHCTTDFSECDRVLRCELMGKYSNILLTEKDVILGALKTTSLEESTKRVLFPGAKYLYPEPQEKASPLDENAVVERLGGFFSFRENEDQEDFAKFLFENVAGFALSTAREAVDIFLRCGGVLKDLNGVAAFLRDFCLNYPCNPCIVGSGKAADFFAFPVVGGREMPSLCKAEDEFYSTRESKKGFEDKKRKLENTAKAWRKKLVKKTQDTFDRLMEAEGAEENRVKGELLTANLYRVQKGDTVIEVDNWYSDSGERVKIKLDATLPPSKNAQRYFKAYNKQKRTKEVLTPMLEAEEKETAYADSVLSSVSLAETMDDLKEIEAELTLLGLLRAPKERVGGKKKAEVPFREFSVDGYKILSGRNNLQNDRLLREAAPTDIWLHTQKYHSSHVLIVTEGKTPPDEVIKKAAEICAYYSDGRDGGKIPVDYCERRFVKKPSKAKAGFVTYTEYKTALVEGKL